MTANGVSGLPTLRRNLRDVVNVTAANALFSTYDYAKRFPVPKKGAKGNGIRFERKVNATLEARFPFYLSSVPFKFFTEHRSGVCILDGMLVTDRCVIIVEVKLRHCYDAWFQLRRLYAPVVGKALGKQVRLLEICQFYEPELVFPEPVLITSSFERFVMGSEEFGCMIWGK